MECGMERRFHRGFTAADTTELWDRWKRGEHEAVLEAVQARLDRNPDKMRLRRQPVEHPFGRIKSWMGSTHFQMKTLKQRKHRNGATRSGLQHETGDAHSGRWRIDGSNPGIRSTAQAPAAPGHLKHPRFHTGWT
jgi:hypothetical protein